VDEHEHEKTLNASPSNELISQLREESQKKNDEIQ